MVWDLCLFDVLAEIVLINKGFVFNEVNNAAEISLCTNRQLDWDGVGFEAILDLSVNLEEVGPGAVHFVDKNHPWNGIAIGLPPDGF
ncbi:MAG: Uncharacterised protein [Prochlorococcus marinus str. MIT 9313]|nr:MAG: Uncharacterised protein [Prochlorococcus marinus str. MIT 9313]